MDYHVGLGHRPQHSRRTPAPIACAARSDWSPSSSTWICTNTRVPDGAGPEVVKAPDPGIAATMRATSAISAGSAPRSISASQACEPDAPGPITRPRRPASAITGSSHRSPYCDAATQRHHRAEAGRGRTGSAAGRPPRSSIRSRRATRLCQSTSPAVDRERRRHDHEPPRLGGERRRLAEPADRAPPDHRRRGRDQHRLPERHQVLDRAVAERMILVRRPRGVDDPDQPGQRGDQVERRVRQPRRDRQRPGRRQRPELERDQHQRDADRREPGRQVQAMRSVHGARRGANPRIVPLRCPVDGRVRPGKRRGGFDGFSPKRKMRRKRARCRTPEIAAPRQRVMRRAFFRSGRIFRDDLTSVKKIFAKTPGWLLPKSIGKKYRVTGTRVVAERGCALATAAEMAVPTGSQIRKRHDD